MDKKLKVSINSNIINKTPKDPNIHWNEGFESKELTLSELGKVIDLGFSYSYQFENSIRKSDNFISTDILSVDMDGDRTIEDTLNDEIVKKYGSLWYTTYSHTPDHHRFRVIFILPRSINDLMELKQSTTSLSRRLGGDMSVVDGARLFFGSENSHPLILGNSISDTYLDELIEDGKVTVFSESKSYSGKTSNRSKLKLDLEQWVTTKGGFKTQLKDIKEKTQIHCPFHNDRNTSSFVSFTKHHHLYLHCSSCKLTWFETYGDYNFNSFEDMVVRFRDQKLKLNSNNYTPINLEKFFTDPYPEWETNTYLKVVDERYISLDVLEDGLTLIKSPKGSGKTTFLSKVLKRIIFKHPTFEDYEDESFESDSDVKMYSDIKILLVGHRQSLIGDLCNKLNLNCYLDDAKYKKSEIPIRKKLYGVCVDSLYKVKDQDYDLIVIDEVEQVLGHFLSGTIGNKGIELFNIFSCLVSNSSKIVALDADVGWVTYQTLTSIVTQNGYKSSRLNLYINQFKPTNRNLNIFPTDTQLIGHLKDSIISGKRVFISSNSKAKVKTLNSTIKKMSKDLGVEIPSILITSENSKSDEVQYFIKNIQKEILQYKVVLSSPSLGTGIDITFENDDQNIDCVYGLFENQINSHFEIDQQLSRVRHPKEVNVWISPRKYDFETEFDVVQDDHLETNLKETIENQFGIKISSIDYETSPFYVLSTMIISYQRHSKNNLKTNFLKYKTDQGWGITVIDVDRELKSVGRTMYLNGKRIVIDEYISHLLCSVILNRYEYQRFNDRKNLINLPISEDLWFSYFRTTLERFYRLPATKELIERDDQGRFRRMVNRFEKMIDKEYQKIWVGSGTGLMKNSLTKDHKLSLQTVKGVINGNGLLFELLSTTPLFNGNDFDPSVVITSNDLDKFSDRSLVFKSFVETQLDISTRKDVVDKPIQHLNRLLGLIGLKLEKIRTTKVAGKKTYLYKIDEDSFKEMMEIIKRRETIPDSWVYLESQYDLSLTTKQRFWLEGVENEYGVVRRNSFDNPDQWLTDLQPKRLI